MVYLRNLFIKKRQPAATHVLLFLLSDEKRNKKPFAIPVQYVPYHSLRDQYVRDLTDSIKREMMRMELIQIWIESKWINFMTHKLWVIEQLTDFITTVFTSIYSKVS